MPIDLNDLEATVLDPLYDGFLPIDKADALALLAAAEQLEAARRETQAVASVLHRAQQISLRGYSLERGVELDVALAALDQLRGKGG